MKLSLVSTTITLYPPLMRECTRTHNTNAPASAYASHDQLAKKCVALPALSGTIVTYGAVRGLTRNNSFLESWPTETLAATILPGPRRPDVQVSRMQWGRSVGLHAEGKREYVGRGKERKNR